MMIPVTFLLLLSACRFALYGSDNSGLGILGRFDLTPPADDDLVYINQETVAMKNAFKDHKVRNSSLRIDELLCVSFLTLAPADTLPASMPTAASLLLENIKAMGSHCSWAIVIHQAPSIENVTDFCKNRTVALSVVFCGPVANKLLSLQRTGLQIPRLLLYREVLQLSLNYRRVFLVPFDVSLQRFDAAKFLQISQCSFYPHAPPILVQPLIEDSSYTGSSSLSWHQDYFFRSPWSLQNRSHILSTAAGMITLR